MDRIIIQGGGLQAAILLHGASLASLYLDGFDSSLVLELKDDEAFASDDQHFGAIAGPVAGRIKDGTAEIAGKIHEFERNENGRTTLHGGSGGLGRQYWQLAAAGPDFAELVLQQPDGMLGFPGNRHFSCRYQLLPGGVLDLQLRASSDAPSLCNLAFHPYFCLDEGPDFSDHSLQILADHYLPVDALNVPTGQRLPVAGSALDYRKARNLADIASGQAGPVDFNYCLASGQRPCQLAARLHSARSGIAMEIATDQPGLQFYTGTHIHRQIGARGRQLGPFAGLCLEPQAWPDAPHQPEFPSIDLMPHRPYYQHSQFCFTRS